MNKKIINSIIRSAFKICYIYCMKCLIPINIMYYINSRSNDNYYDIQIINEIKHMKRLLISISYENNNKYNNIDVNTAYKEAKKKIIRELKEKYGNNIDIQFTM